MTTEVIEATKMALEKMNPKYCKLSQINYDALVDYNEEPLDDNIKEAARLDKYLERPFTYEFYHQLRKLMDCGCVYFGDCVLQPEVDKEYQHYFKKGYIPDFIIHVQNRNNGNLAV
jgi:hypothetical protein